MKLLLRRTLVRSDYHSAISSSVKFIGALSIKNTHDKTISYSLPVFLDLVFSKTIFVLTTIMNHLLTIMILLFLPAIGKTQTKTSADSILHGSISIPNLIINTCSQDGEYMFKGCLGVRGDIKNFKIEGIPVKIEKFIISIAKKDGDTIVIENEGGFYQNAAWKAFDSLSIGDKVLLSDFVVTVAKETKPRRLKQVLSSVYSGKQYEFRY